MTESKSECPICLQSLVRAPSENDYGRRQYYNCKNCGMFGLPRDLFETPLNEKLKITILGMLVGKTHGTPIQNTPLITNDKIKSHWEANSEPTATEMLDNFLNYYCSNGGVGKQWHQNSINLALAAKAYSFDSGEWASLQATQMGWLSGFKGTGGRSGSFLVQFDVSAKGWQRFYENNQTLKTSNQAFVAMWFGNEVDEAYTRGIYPAISEAGYDPMRIDAKHHNNKIDDEIVAEIKKSKFLVADFSSGFVNNGTDGCVLIARGGVYYEAGFAHGMGIPVIWTCREDCIAHVHFDTRQYNHITWKTPEELKVKLKNRIEATID